MRLILFSIFSIFIFANTRAQVINMPASGTNTVSFCSGTFFDPGGSGGNYADNTNSTFTICSNNPAQVLRVDFTAFDIEPNFDYLYIYDGPNTSSNVIRFPYTSNFLPGSIVSSGTCLTFRFVTDGSITRSGWSANISCVAASSANSSYVCPGVNVTSPNYVLSTNSVEICDGACADLTANVVSGFNTNSYAISSIPYAPFPYTAGNQFLVRTDDLWSPILNLPFSFNFFGNCYNQCVLGSNGVISFNTGYQNNYNDYTINNALLGDTELLNSICGAYTDIDPSVGGDMRYQIYGTSPCRALVISWSSIPMYNCNSNLHTSQIVIYETTNIVEVYIQNKPTCSSWVHGQRGIVGIQNANGTTAYTAPNRNYPTTWTATNEAWRFTPNGTANFSNVWLRNGVQIGSGLTLNTCPTSNTVLTAQTTYQTCSGPYVISKDMNVVVKNTGVAINPVARVCPGSALNLTANGAVTATYNWSGPSGYTASGSSVSRANATSSMNGTYTVSVTSQGCTNTASVAVNVGVPLNNPCTNIYVTSSASNAGAGTIASPTSLQTALTLAACNNGVIKMAIGTYNISSPIDLQNLITIEGGFDPVNGWRKSSLPGATTINRTATGTYPYDGTASAPALVAMRGTNVSNFRLQDITLSTANAPVPSAGQVACSTYGLHLNGCSSYSVVRTRILPGTPAQGLSGTTIAGSGGAGGAGAAGAGGTGRGGCNTNGNSGGGGSTGNAGASGGGGGGGGPGDGCNIFGCNANPRSGNNAGNGNTGGQGTDAPTAAAATPAVATPFFVPGGQAANGANGAGGGGGGGGGGAAWGTDCTCSRNGSGNGGSGGVGGGGGFAGTGGFGSGGSFAVYLVSNGTGGSFVDVQLSTPATVAGGAAGSGQSGGSGSAGSNGANFSCGGNSATGGRGGNGGNGGRGGNGQPGANGRSSKIVINGTAPSFTNSSTSTVLIAGENNPSDFNFAAQPTISAANVNCSNVDISFATSAASNTWNFGAGSAPTSIVGNNVTTQFTTLGRRDIVFSGNTFTGFHNIAQAGGVAPDILTSGLNTAGLPVDVYQICRGGTATFTSSFLGSSYDWNFGGAAANPPTTAASVTQTFNTTGTFTITLRVNTDCCGPSPFKTITLLVDPVPAVTVSPNNQTICEGGTATISLSGLNSGHSLAWSPLSNIVSQTTATLTVNPVATTNYLATISSIVGIRTVCPVTLSSTVTVANIPSINSTVTNVGCANLGAITVSPANGVGPYTYAWLGGQTSSTLSNLNIGNYDVTVTDSGTSAACKATATFVVTRSLSSFNVVADSLENIRCFGLTNGYIRVQGTGGVQPFTYAWNGGATGNVRSGLTPGSYTVTATDAASCTVSLGFNLTQPATLTFSLGATADNTSCLAANGSIATNVSGGTTPYSYVWSPSLSNVGTQTGLQGGTYRLTVSDANGCSVSPITVTLASPVTPTATASNDGPQCANRSVTLRATGVGTYAWTGPAGYTAAGAYPDIDNINSSKAGVYTVTVTNSAGCTSVASTTVVLSACTEVCGNGLDDDGDGLIDTNDPDCPCRN